MNALDYDHKLLTLDPSHCLIQFSIVQNKIVLDFQLILHVCKICCTQFDFTRLEKIDLSQLQMTWDNKRNTN